jgi:hypothetical protein
MNFYFVSDLGINNFLINSKNYMGLYISTRCSFSINVENYSLFREIINKSPAFSIGKFMWEKFKQYLMYIRENIKKSYTSYSWEYLIFNHTTSEAIVHHRSNGMEEITIDIDGLLRTSRNINGKNIFELYDFTERSENLYFIL